MATATSYAALPERIAIHFRLDGTPNGWGPRAAVWLVVSLQLIIAVVNGLAYAGGAPLMQLLVTDWALALLWQAQSLILSTAARRAERASISGFWLAAAGVTVAAAVAARLL